MPVLYLGHGAPILVDDAQWPNQLRDWGKNLPTPTAILMVSAHWEQGPVTLGASEHQVPLVYDFYGFPRRYYQTTYPAPVAPDLAKRVERLLTEKGQPVRHEDRGLDHGAYVPLLEMYPKADVPVLQVSMPSLRPQDLFELGKTLAPLRDEGILIIGSGFTTHNMRAADLAGPVDAPPVAPLAEFDQWAAEAMKNQDVDTLLNYRRTAPAPQIAHPWPDHWMPIYLALGAAAADGSLDNHEVITGTWYGMSKRSWQLD